ncbi:MAG: prolyl oligopeptidase family serine peptidase [Candidatus Sumerlaeota bacterium]|nr:prolyl oligopeptidase family serine peptidase [Candidatus Sumerlaeota bacterium]
MPLGSARELRPRRALAGGSGAPLAEVPKETLAEFSLLPHVSEKSAPFFITHSKSDHLIPPDSPRSLYEALKKAGVDAELDFVDGTGAGHALVMSAAEATRHDSRMWAFVKKHFGVE